MKYIFLVGPPGSGKTSSGQALARLLACRFFDTDALIEASAGQTVSEIFGNQGETRFRQLESQLLDHLEAIVPGKGAVLATGGGLPVYNNNMEKLLRLGAVVALGAKLPVLIERVRANRDRPLLAATPGVDVDEQLHSKLSQLLADRSSVYARAGYKIDTSGLNPDEVAHEIYRMLSNSHQNIT